MSAKYYLTNSVMEEEFAAKNNKDGYCLRVVGAKDFDDALAREAALECRMEKAIKLLEEARVRVSPSVIFGGPTLSESISAFIENWEPVQFPPKILVSNIWVDGIRSGCITIKNGFMISGDSTFSVEDCVAVIRDDSESAALKPAAECLHEFHYFGDYPKRRCNLCNAIERDGAIYHDQ